MIEVLHPGIHTSIQDIGRMGFQSLGVPICGAMDQNAMHWANYLLNNPKQCAVLEMSFKGPKLLFHEATTIALTGADMQAKVNGVALQNHKAIQIKENTILEFGIAQQGKRTYLAIAGGIQSPVVLGSRSQYKDITPQTVIGKTKLIPFNKTQINGQKGARLSFTASDWDKKLIPAYKGPDFHLLPKKAQTQLKNNAFTISVKNSRMAYVLEEKLIHQIPSIWTVPVLPGTVQCTPNGTLIVLMRDAQTTGGYPRVLQISDEGLNLLAQKSTKADFQFKIGSV